MLKIKKYILLSLSLCLGLPLLAQKATVRVTIEPSDILIGEQAVVNLEVKAPKGRTIIFPAFAPGDTLITGIEVLQMEKVDTTMTEIMTLNQKYIVTSFDSTLYHVPYMEVIDGADTLRTNDFGLKVTSPQLSDSTMAYLELLKGHQTDSIDFEKLQISDIKDIQEPPFVWTDYLSYILIALGVLVLISVIILGIYLDRKRKRTGYIFRPKVVLPPHVIALKELDNLKERKLSQKGMEKEYYTQLTDILRNYIDHRFGINAPEMISDDIIEAIHKATEAGSPERGLEQILKLADLVKFARYMPLPDENDLSLVNAYLFVNQTKLEEVKPAADSTVSTDGNPPAVSAESQQSTGNKETK